MSNENESMTSRRVDEMKRRRRWPAMRHFLLLLTCISFSFWKVGATSLWEKSCPNNCTCTVEPWPYIQLDAKVVRCENRTMSVLPANLTTETEVLLLGRNNLGGASDVYLHDFRYLQSMRFLDLSSNRIRIVHAHGIGFPQVRCVNLSHNNIHNLYPEVLAEFPGLEWLNVEHNSIGSLPKTIFTLPNLKYLNLGQNKVFTLKPEFKFNTPQLETLIMAHNYLTRLPNGIFFRTAQFKKMDLSSNRLSKVEDLAFDGIRSVSELNLEGNCLRSIPTAALRTIASIGHLTFNRNPLKRLDSTSFKGLNVTHISLCHMDELEAVYDHAFADMPYLTTLEMNSNKALTSVAPNTFNALPSLQTMDLRNNNLYVIEESIRSEVNVATRSTHEQRTKEYEKSVGKSDDVSDEMTMNADAPMTSNQLTLHLIGNPLICDCNLKWVQDIVLRQYNHNVTVPEGNSVKCLDRAHDAAVGLIDLDELPQQCPPFVLPLFHPVVKEMISSDVSFDCRGVGNPPPKIRWVLPDGRILKSDGCEDRACVNGNTLSVKIIHVQDSGVYECQAENPLGTFKRSLHLEVDSVNVMLSPHTVTSTFVTLTWNASGLPVTRFLLKYGLSNAVYELELNGSSDNGLKVIEMGTKKYSYTVGGLSPGETYTFWLCIKRSEYSIKISSLDVKTREEGFLFMWGIRRNYASIIMVGAAIGIVLIGCTFMCCLKLCRWARKEHSEMVASDMGSRRYFVKSDSCNSQVAFMTSYINLSDDSALVDHEEESPQ